MTAPTPPAGMQIAARGDELAMRAIWKASEAALGELPALVVVVKPGDETLMTTLVMRLGEPRPLACALMELAREMAGLAAAQATVERIRVDSRLGLPPAGSEGAAP